MSDDQKTAINEANLSVGEATAKAILELEADEAFKKYAKDKQEFEKARVRADVAALYENKTRSGLGTRVKVGATRGKNPTVISFEQWDDAQPDTLPKSLQQFLEYTKADEKTMLDYALRGHNEALNEAASDPLAEFIPGHWKDDVKNTFRIAVRNYSRGLSIPLEEAVATIRVGFVAKFGDNQ